MIVLVSVMAVTAFAAETTATTDPLAVVNNLSDFVFGLIRAVGLILLGWGIVHGGIIITFAKEILTLITG